MAREKSTITAVERLQHEAAIEELKFEYAALCDSGYDPEQIAPMFVEDARWESNAFGTYNGRSEIYDFFASISADIVWAKHFMLNPIIEVADDGTKATARWCLFMPCTMVSPEGDGEPDAVLNCGSYRDDLVREGDSWKFQHVRVEFDFVSNLDRGWVQQPLRGS
jgi:hypothetical protein